MWFHPLTSFHSFSQADQSIPAINTHKELHINPGALGQTNPPLLCCTSALPANDRLPCSTHEQASSFSNPPHLAWQLHPLLFGQAARQTIVSPAFSLQPPFPRLGLASTALWSLIDPPTTYLFGGSFDGTLQQDVYSLSYKSLTPPLLTVNLFKARGLAPSPRYHALMTSYKTNIVVWGGQTSPTTGCTSYQRSLTHGRASLPWVLVPQALLDHRQRYSKIFFTSMPVKTSTGSSTATYGEPTW